jgi:hypothetical protein
VNSTYLSLSIRPPVLPSVRPSIHPSIHPPIYIYSCCSHLENRASAKQFVSFQFLNFRVGRTPWMGDQLDARLLPTQDNKNRINADIHALSGIWTHDPSVRAGEDILWLWPLAHCDRLFNVCSNLLSSWVTISFSIRTMIDVRVFTCGKSHILSSFWLWLITYHWCKWRIYAFLRIFWRRIILIARTTMT